MNKINITHDCWGHNCERYANPQILYNEIIRIAKEKKPITYYAFLLELGITPSTPNHWRKCKPNNLKLLEYVEMWVENAVSYMIKDNPNLVLKYWELTRNRSEETPKEKTIEISELIKKGEKNDNPF